MSARALDARRALTFLEEYIAAAGLRLHVSVTGGGGASESTVETRPVTLELTGADTSLLLARHGELLHALEHLCAKLLGLSPEEHHRMHLEAGGFKAAREQELAAMADQAVEEVRTSGYPFRFPAMSSRERRGLHLLLAPSGLRSESAGDGPWRSVVLHPSEEKRPTAPGGETVDSERLLRLRKSFGKRS